VGRHGQHVCGEECDDGNTSNGDACRNDCANVCGERPSHPAAEECEDRNTTGRDAVTRTAPDRVWQPCGEPRRAVRRRQPRRRRRHATRTARRPAAATAYRRPAKSVDDGNGNPFDGCTRQCILLRQTVQPRSPKSATTANDDPSDGCHDGLHDLRERHVTPPEQCDDGNWSTATAARRGCAVPGCGNAIPEGDESATTAVCVAGRRRHVLQRSGAVLQWWCEAAGGDGCAANCTEETAYPIPFSRGPR